jgi:hypothetical protein
VGGRLLAVLLALVAWPGADCSCGFFHRSIVKSNGRGWRIGVCGFALGLAVGMRCSPLAAHSSADSTRRFFFGSVGRSPALG